MVSGDQSGNGIKVSGGTLQNTASKAFSYETIVTDPSWYLSSSNKTVTNTAMLFSANNKVNHSAASVETKPRSTRKDMLKADAGVNPESIEGWVFAEVEVMDEAGKMMMVEKLLKPFDVK